MPGVGLTKKKRKGQMMSYKDKKLSYYNVIMYYTSNCTAWNFVRVQ